MCHVKGDPNAPGNFLLVRMKSHMAKGATFMMELYRDGKKVDTDKEVYEMHSHEKLTATHEDSAIHSVATAHITRYANNVFVLDLLVDDKRGKIQKILTEGDTISTEVMVTNAKQWMNNPPIILPLNWRSHQSLRTTMTLRYYKGDDEKATFMTKGYRDKSSVVFEDAWF